MPAGDSAVKLLPIVYASAKDSPHPTLEYARETDVWLKGLVGREKKQPRAGPEKVLPIAVALNRDGTLLGACGGARHVRTHLRGPAQT